MIPMMMKNINSNNQSPPNLKIASGEVKLLNKSPKLTVNLAIQPNKHANKKKLNVQYPSTLRKTNIF